MITKKPFTPQITNLLLLTFFVLLPSLVYSQYYWVGNSGNWSDYENHWATTSGGSDFHSQAPSESDDVIFDENSFSSTGQIVTIDIDNSNCLSMTWENVTNNPGLQSDVVLNIFGSMILSPNMTCDLRIIELESSSIGNTLNTFGTSLGSGSILRIYDKGSWDLESVLDVFMIQYLEGTFNTNNNTINASSFIIDFDTEKVFNLGSSTINASTWRLTASNLTLNAGTSTINANGFYADSDESGPYEYNNVNLVSGGLLDGNAIINKLSFQPEGNFDDFRIESGVTIEVNEVEAVGSKGVPIIIYADTPGEEAFIKKSSGSIDAEYVILTDIHGIGGATFNANQSVDNGNNTGWNFTAIPEGTYFWVGNSGNWSDLSHWANSSGGSSFHTSLPTQFDKVIFDTNSFTIDHQIVEVDTAVFIGSFVSSGVTNQPNINAPYEAPLNVLKELDFGDGLEGFIYNTSFTGTGMITFNQGPNVRMQNISYWGKGQLDLTGPIYNGSLSLFDGTFNTNNFQMDLGQFKQGNFNEPIINFGSSIVNVTSNFSFQDPDTEFNAGTSIITTNKNFAGLGNHFNKVILTGTGNLEGENSFEELVLAPGSSISLEAEVMQTINQSLTVKGTSSEPINLSSMIEGTQASISLSSGTVEGTFLVLKDINATGGAVFNANESVDNGNNSGWNITFPIPKNYYWVNGEGEWEDYENHWAKSSGGTDFHISPPTILDNVLFDENSFNVNGQKVTIQSDKVSFKNMVWDNLSFKPHFIAQNVDLNIYGTVFFTQNMEMSITNLNFLSDGVEGIKFENPSYPGTNTTMIFNGGGTWTIQDSLTTRVLELQSGTIDTDDNGIHVDFATYFSSENEKVFNLGKSILNTRTLEWNSFAGNNLTLNGGESTIICSSSFSPESQIIGDANIIELNNLRFTSERSDQGRIYSNLNVNTLTIDAGKSVQIQSYIEVEFTELIATGNNEAFITIFGAQEDNQATLIQKSGTVDAAFLKLKDIKATGGATFNAYSSINEGNVSGWTFFKVDQTIDFPALNDIPVSTNSINLTASASSDLPVSYSVISGAATIDGNILNLGGEPGVISVKADQEGDINFNPAPAVIRDFCANPSQATISQEAGELISSSAEGNQWYLNGNLIEGASAVTYTPVDDGEYTVIVTINECGSEVSETFNFVSSDTYDALSSQDLKIHPNPSRDYITISDLYPSRDRKISLIDVNGKFVSVLKFAQNEAFYVGDLKAGIYFIEIRDEHSKTIQKLIKL